SAGDGEGDGWDKCEREGCETGEEHTRWFFHGDGKVGVQRRRLDEGEKDGKETDVWVKCRVCGSGSMPRTLEKRAA
ncbi:hypothetical protein CTJ10_12545, partial [Staphylococcus epidermidis]